MFFTPPALFESDLFTWLYFHSLRPWFGSGSNTKSHHCHLNQFNTFLNCSASLTKHARILLNYNYLQCLKKQPAELESFCG